ncbi:MAG: gas vesicle protein GvpO [bacterium]|nr:gas vesicle protein GvpO [bacterium]
MAEETKQLKTGSKGIAKAVAFIKEMLGKEGDIVKATKTDAGWEVEIEVVEQSEYMKRIGISKPVYDKNIYRVLLDRNFELVSYERKSQKPFGGAAE